METHLGGFKFLCSIWFVILNQTKIYKLPCMDHLINDITHTEASFHLSWILKEGIFPLRTVLGCKRPEMSVHLWNSVWYNCCTTCSLGWGGKAVARGGAESWWLQSTHRFCFKQNESSLEVLILSKKGRLLRDVWLGRGNRSPAFEEDKMGSSTKQTCSLHAAAIEAAK